MSMLRVSVAAAALLSLAIPAHAACNTGALNGVWLLQTEDGVCEVKIRQGALAGSCGSGSIALSRTCGVTGSIGGASFSGRTENVGTGAAKPNIVIGAGPEIGPFIGFRK